MGTPFPNQVVGAGGALVVPVVRSPNFSIADQTGWAIFSNGDAYFFNVTADGAVTSNTVIIDGPGNGVFVYNGLPAEGNLIVSVANSSGYDDWDNAYSGPGISLSVPGSTPNSIQIRPDLGALLMYAT